MRSAILRDIQIIKETPFKQQKAPLIIYSVIFPLLGYAGVAVCCMRLGRFGSCHCFGCGRDVRQWHVPKAWARISPGCRAVGSPDSLYIQCRVVFVSVFLFCICRRCLTKLCLVHVGMVFLKSVPR